MMIDLPSKFPHISLPVSSEVPISPDQFIAVVAKNYSLQMILKEITPFFINSMNIQNSPQIATSFQKSLNLLSSKDQNFILIEVAKQSSASSNAKQRIFAVHLLPFLNDSELLNKIARQLVLDTSPHVRVSLLNVLSSLQIGPLIKKHILNISCFDRDLIVRQTAARIFGNFIPENVSSFSKLLSDPQTSSFALQSLPSVISLCGFARLKTAIETCLLNVDPDSGATAVLFLSRIVKKEELSVLIDFARKILISPRFQSELPNFIDFLNDRNLIKQLINPNGITNWRIRKLLLYSFRKITIESDLIAFAMSYSHDDVATIRNQSVFVWKYLFDNGIDVLASVSTLVDCHWHQRIVLTKVIKEIGVEHFDSSLLQTLAHDQVFNVRLLTAKTLSGTDAWNDFYGDLNDPEIEGTRFTP